MQRAPSRASAAGGPSQLPRRLPRRLVAAAAADQAQGVLRRPGSESGGTACGGGTRVMSEWGGGRCGRRAVRQGERGRGREAPWQGRAPGPGSRGRDERLLKTRPENAPRRTRRRRIRCARLQGQVAGRRYCWRHAFALAVGGVAAERTFICSKTMKRIALLGTTCPHPPPSLPAVGRACTRRNRGTRP